MDPIKATSYSPWTRPYYFSAADGGIEHNIADHSFTFENSLVYSILFQQGGIILPDIFFFNNEAILRHVTQPGGKWSFLQTALRYGLVTPAFRGEATDSFKAGLSAIGEQNVLGLERTQYERVGTTPLKVAEALDEALVGSSFARRAYWEKDMGAEFEVYLNRLFAFNELPHAIFGRQAELWAETADFRQSVLSAARDATVSADPEQRPGIRRAEVWNVMGRKLGILDDNAKFDKPRQLIEEVKKGRDRSTFERVQFLVNLVNVAYENSQADAFNANRHSVAALTPTAMAISENVDREYLMPSRLELEIRVPSLRSILEAPPHKVLDVYRSGIADEYFAKRRLWIENTYPEDDTRKSEEVVTAADAYARELCKVVPGTRSSLTFVVGGSSAATLLKEVGNSYLGYIGNVQPSLAIYALVFGVGGAATSYLVTRPRRPRHQRISLQRPPTKYPELGS
ncbi:hypothetical protein [Actinoplanes sp. TFC3]|uniref:hypothetical protein n=1 Tax=Actinoplanes sp. TFC3 TaxID=1710355 RepID=UPI00082B9FBC|nr:hypothetical protein [Actinoplanes sp. TFC3]